MKILLIENNKKTADKIGRLLSRNRFDYFTAFRGENGADEAMSGIYDAVILDVALPDCSGLDVLRQVRKSGHSVPILMISPKCGISDKVRGLNSGADDFLERPFADAELLARLCAVSRRKGEMIPDNALSFGKLSLNLSTYELSDAGGRVPLSNKEFELMKFFLMQGHNVSSKENSLTKLWGFDNPTAENSLEVHITYLRHKLKQIHSGIRIHCIKNVGYQLIQAEN
ncbi:response regulator transcription factor [Caproiciproducens faecalis]|uniref:Stage 0 sporulation protein A homolog n=1 Tax=Caproiciproducens faecalis TaxID=2820301 RepID=A0ABS7DLS0_9FIRM|nr:response regulator transcription factor [Caproiciproducens faecalis]MBW7572232.1 response regulator transcription factor [Caproiciproducens faecalis]